MIVNQCPLAKALLEEYSEGNKCDLLITALTYVETKIQNEEDPLLSATSALSNQK